MARAREFRVVVATDGSAGGRAAVAVAATFPWPARARVLGVVARSRPPLAAEWPGPLWAAVDESLDRVAVAARRVLRGRWPTAEVVVLDKPPVEAILAEARGAAAIVVGSRGHGALGRLVLGSVSRDVVRKAACSTLVVKGQPEVVRRMVVGIDGSANARRAVDFVAGLPAPRGGQVILVRALEPMRIGSIGLMPAGVRGVLAGQLAASREAQARAAQRELGAATAVLRRAGWSVRSAIRWGIPIEELLAASRASDAHVLVVGARGTGGVARMLLGSVAEGALSRSRVPVLIVR
jgi:nucleotide-binding universal stress UspA family protein